MRYGYLRLWFYRILVAREYVQVVPSHHSLTLNVCPFSEACCLPKGGPPSKPQCPSDKACPGNWYWHTTHNCCVPENANPPTPTCNSGPLNFWDHNNQCCTKPSTPPPSSPPPSSNSCPSGHFFFPTSTAFIHRWFSLALRLLLTHFT